MKKISISAALERQIRREVEKGAGSPLTEIVELLDGHKKRAAGSTTPGIGYKELVALFRLHLGDDLVVPPSPSAGYIVRMVNRAQELGINKENVQQLVFGLRKVYPRGPYRLEFVVQRGDVHYYNGDPERGYSGVDSGSGSGSGVFTGRGAQDTEL